MASLILSKASSSVSPCETHPFKVGQYTTYPPSLGILFQDDRIFHVHLIGLIMERIITEWGDAHSSHFGLGQLVPGELERKP